MIGWLSSKVAVLLFAVVLFAALFSVSVFLHSFSRISSIDQEAFALARVVDSTCSAPFNLEQSMTFSEQRQVTANQEGNTFTVSVAGIERAVHCKVSPVSLTSVNVTVKKTGGVVTLG